MVCKSATSGLKKKDGRKQIVEIGNPDEVPLDIAILFDISSSVSEKGFFAFQQKAAASFLKQVLKPVDRAAVFTIADEPTLVSPLASGGDCGRKVVDNSRRDYARADCVL